MLYQTSRSSPPTWFYALVASVVILLTGRASGAAAVCPSPPGVGAAAGLAELDPDLRLKFVEDSLRRGARPARIWSWSWGLGLAVIGGAQLAIGVPPLVEDRGQRAELIIGGAKSLLGIVPLVATPLTVMGDARPLEERLPTPELSGDRCALLVDAERRLARAAASEAFGRSWLRHLGTVALNVGAGLILGFGYDRWITGALGAAVGIIVGEAIIYTQPTHSIDALTRYRTGTLVSTP